LIERALLGFEDARRELKYFTINYGLLACSAPSLTPATAVFADTNVAQISSISSSTQTIDDQFVVSVALDIRIRKNRWGMI
jgi:hypothetical protein